MGLLLYCNTGSLRRHNPFVPCSISLSNKYVILKTCSRNITGSTNLAHSGKVNLQVPVSLSLQSLSSFLGKEKLAKYTSATGRCFYSELNYVTTLHIKFCISLAKVCEHSVLPNIKKDPLLIVSYFAEVISKNLIS